MRRKSPRAKLYGQTIRQAREEQGLTLARFAQAVVDAATTDGEHVTLTAAAVSRWEAGYHEPALRYRTHIATVLGADVRHLFPPIPKDWAA